MFDIRKISPLSGICSAAANNLPPAAPKPVLISHISQTNSEENIIPSLSSLFENSQTPPHLDKEPFCSAENSVKNRFFQAAILLQECRFDSLFSP